nr:MAG TPA: hypothetical protein [Caudoviricetes sp.]
MRAFDEICILWHSTNLRFCKIQQFYHQSFTVSRLKLHKSK